MSSRTSKQRTICRPQATSVKTLSEIQAAAAAVTTTSATVASSLDYSLASGTLVARRRREEEPGCFGAPPSPSPPPRRSGANSGRIAFALVALGWPLRSVYCLAALVSLLLLIVYIHQASAQSTADQQRVKMLQLETRPRSSTSTGSSSSSSSSRIGSARDQERSMPAASLKKSHKPTGNSTKGGGSGHRSHASGPISRWPPDGSRSSAELTFRQADGDHSENNRGSPAASRAQASGSQRPPVGGQNNEQPWRPIVGQRAQPAAAAAASDEARRVAAAPTAPANLPPPVPAVAPSNTHETMDRFHHNHHHQLPPAHHWGQSAAHREHHHHHQHHHHHHHHQQQHRSHSNHRTHGNSNNIRHTHHGGPSESRRTWRRPRLNQQLAHEMLPVASDFRPPPLGKMYKRVLICDKTLVSLDYVREFALEPRPFPMAHYFEGPFDDNVIDLDLRPDFLDRRASASSLVYTTSGGGGGTTNMTTTTTLDTGGGSGSNTTVAPASQSTGQSAAIATTEDEAGGGDLAVGASALGQPAERRHFGGPPFVGGGGAPANLLPDEDALVKCDMWDLEKGLKNRKPPGEILELAVRADFDTVRDAINRCRQLTEKSLPPDDELRGDGLEIMSTEDLISLFSMKRGLLPGTKWCGLGDQASTYNDLGPKHRIDICCRAHDHCPIRLKPFRNDYGVLNIALYTKSHCDCDADFYRCLREAHSRTADMLGNLYFNVMKLQCIREERLKVCREMRPIALGFERCVRYEENPMKRVFKFTTPPVAY